MAIVSALTARSVGAIAPGWSATLPQPAQPHQAFGSMPMRSLTADRIRCLQPRYRSVVCTETCPKRNWICSKSPPDAWQSRAQVRRRSCGANCATPMLLADSFTMCQTAFTVIPSPHALPTLLTRRNSFPRSIAAAASQSSSSVRTQSGTGTVRTWPPLPTRSTMAQCSSRYLEMIQCQTHGFTPSQPTRE